MAAAHFELLDKPMGMMGSGYGSECQSNKVIARKLGIAEATVKAQMVKLFVKIGAANRT
jgi:DNA-binding CsgD family transcriptional regulator